MSDLGDAFVRIRPNFTGFQSETESALGKSLKRAAEIVGVAYGAKQAFDFAKGAANDAAAVQKSQEVIRAQFGASGKALIEFADTAGIHLGIAAHESDAVAARFGILFKNMGIGQAQGAHMTLQLEKLAGSIAAIRGIDPSTVLERLPIALAGNIRGLKQLGIAIDAQAIKAEALRLGFGKQVDVTNKTIIADRNLEIAKANLTNALSKYGSGTTQVAKAQNALLTAQGKVTNGVKETLSSLTPAQRAMVIYSLATKNLGDFQKQAALHANDFANVQRRLSAEWDKAKETLGRALLPQLTHYANALAVWLDKMDKSGKLQRDVNQIVSVAVGIFKAVAEAVKIAFGAFNLLAGAVGGAKNAMILFFAALAVGKVVALTNAIVSGLVGTGLKVLGVAAGEEAAAYVSAFGTMEIATVGLQGTIASLIGTLGLLATGVGAVVAAYGIYKMISSTTGVASQQYTTDGKGHYYFNQPTKYGSVRRSVSKAEYDKATGADAATSTTPGDQKGGARGQTGVVRTSGNADFADESPALKRALENLAKRYGDITLISGFRSEAHQTALWDASVAAGRTGFMPNGNPIARPKSRGGSGSPHSAGIAADGTILYQGKRIPLSSLPPSILAAYGLSTVAGDVNHVQLGGGSTTTIPTTTVPPVVDPLTGLTVGQTAKKALSKTQVEAAKKSLSAAYDSIKARAAELGSALTAKIKSDMAKTHKEISNVADRATIAKARADVTTLRAEVTKQLQLMRIRISQTNAFESLKRDAAKLGSDTTPAIQAAMKKIQASIGTAVTAQGIANVKKQMADVRTLIAAQITKIKEQVQGMQTAFENAWGRIGNAADSAFDKATAKALKSMQIMVQAASGSFLFGGSITKTPAEIALASLQASHQSAIDQKALTDAQANLATAQQSASDLMNPTEATVNAAKQTYDKLYAQLQVAQDKLTAMQADTSGKTTASQTALQGASVNVLQSQVDAAQQKLTDLLSPTPETLANAKQGVTDAQAALDDLHYNAQVNAMQTQADLERTAADEQLSAAQDAYSAQRDLLKTAMDDRIEAIRIGMENGSITADDGMKQLTAVLGDPKYALDIENSGVVIGGALYKGLKAGLDPVFKLLNDLLALMKKAGIKLPDSPVTNTSLTQGLSAIQALQVSNAPDPVALANAFREANQPVVDELKTQTDLLAGQSVTLPGGISVNSAVLAAIR